MTYHCGTYGLAKIGIPNDVPRVVCDECGLINRIREDRPPPAWLLNNKAPKGWIRVPVEGSDKAQHFCPRCKTKRV